MSDDLTPAQTEAVRRALRAARHEAPLPDAVAARLDDRLAELVNETFGGEPAAYSTVVPIDRFRRRNRRMTLLVAAAAATVIGVGGTQWLQHTSDSHSLQTADRAEATAPSPSSLAGADAGAHDLDNTFDNLSGTTSGLVQLRLTPEQRAYLAHHDITQVRPIRPVLASAKSLNNVRTDSVPHAQVDTDGPTGELYAAAAAVCRTDLPPDLPVDTRLFRGLLRSKPVILVLRPEDGATLVAAYPCDGGAPTTLPLD
ncbi:hypothetical protein [Nocardioides jejuensis]|uniref:Uncharacterized protein n=1 Tax=Nocardioides jejuensis TaxID=2502782 RepID=A0A4R1CH80_9ACTN|nr:hypothetical protein [Nocardioides jejuensis]TCJ30610.1 hypothetical protein EPD65_03345 [Nocardioides jejuensis]